MPYFIFGMRDTGGEPCREAKEKPMGGLKKKDMLETIQLLEEANSELNRNAGHPEIGEILTQCQESAFLIGSHLENAYPETNRDTVKNLVGILEDYCENIYQISVNLTDGKNLRKITKKITRQLSLLHNGIKYDLPEDRREIVFLPYKASMWDSLESIWKAADADENADAYVIPIPYYDKNPDGSFREMHYEGDQYPSYVPVTYYEDYDFEIRKPDVIYIHNPYDEYNYVTSVHPSFYSGNLKKYTNKLVYIPYFILGEIDPDDKEKLKGIEHFCIQPGVLNADKVVVQSEDMKKAYVNILTEYAGKDSRKHWEDKILGLGSPKFDKVLSTKKEDLTIPEEWQRIIRKPDGSWKKIIFYNTGVTALLNHNEQMLKKMESVFETFYENREEAALLWRPHPLIESTLASMRPQLWEAYREIRDRYRRDGWGIYDDTADMDRAIEISDAYYGDGSSIVQLYQRTGKPVMMQNVDV